MTCRPMWKAATERRMSSSSGSLQEMAKTLGLERRVPSLSLSSPRRLGRHTQKLKPKLGQRWRPKVRCSVEKLVDWNCRSGMGSLGLDLAKRVASVAPTASCPEQAVSHSQAMRACRRFEVRISFSVPGDRVRNVKRACT